MYCIVILYESHSLNLKVVSSNLYMMSLDISVLDQKEVSNTHTVTITTKGIKKTVNFNLAVKMKQVRIKIENLSLFVVFRREKWRAMMRGKI